MKQLFLYSILAFMSFACKVDEQKNIQLCNPLPMPFGDPFLLQRSSNETFYMYGTSENINGFKAFSSNDLCNWKDEGVIYLSNQEKSWGINCFWAPEVYERNGKFYLWYSANWKHNPTNEGENFRIGVAVADSPLGPFKDLYGRPIFDPGYPIIDANLYFDDEANKVYLYYSRCCYKNPVQSEISDWAKAKGWFDEIEESWIYGIEIKPDFSGVIGKPQLLLRPPVEMNDAQSEWESRSVTSNEVNRRWSEGSFLFKEKDTYYMMYSANFFGGQNYAVGYATSKHPLGPFEKAPNNPVLQRKAGTEGEVTGTGHNMVLSLPNKQKLCVYHGRTDRSGDQRIVFISKLHIDEDGQLIVDGPAIDKKPAILEKPLGTN
jgi:beta-xylosidase